MSLEVEAYIEQYPESIQEIMWAVRALVFEVIPEAKEKMSYGMPTFYTKTSLFHFAGQKHHLGIYPTPEGITFIEPKLSGYKYSKGAIQFPYDKEIPMDILREILEYKKATQ